MRIIAITAALYLPAFAANAETANFIPRAGDTYEIVSTREMSQQDTGGSSGSSHDRDTMIERVVAVREDGLELEYEVPKNPKSPDRNINWQFPARVFKPFHGALKLLNSAELEARVDGWLKSGGLTRAMCGRWIFTWNAFRIKCDPQSAIQIIDQFDLEHEELRAGSPYRDPEAFEPVLLKNGATKSDGSTFIAEMTIDPASVRRERAEADVVIAEVSRKPLTFDEALQRRSSEVISGTITITFDTDPAGRLLRRTRITKLAIKLPDGEVETQTVTQVLERKLIVRPNS